MRLIDADALIEFIDMGHYRNPLESCFSERDVVDMLESRPTIDAVPVVRCKGCYHKTEDGNGKPYCLELEMYLNKELDFFCSYGERKDGDGNGRP